MEPASLEARDGPSCDLRVLERCESICKWLSEKESKTFNCPGSRMGVCLPGGQQLAVFIYRFVFPERDPDQVHFGSLEAMS